MGSQNDTAASHEDSSPSPNSFIYPRSTKWGTVTNVKTSVKTLKGVYSRVLNLPVILLLELRNVSVILYELILCDSSTLV